MAGRRRLVQGLFKRNGSGNWQGRFRIPADLWQNRKRLLALGIKDLPKAQEHGRSTGELDRDEAGNVYRTMLVAWNAKMDAWRKLLEEGPQSLSEKQTVALAADHAKAFLVLHDENPSSAPPSKPVPEPQVVDEGAWAAMLNGMSDDERRRLQSDFKAFHSEKDEVRRSSVGFRIVKDHPSLAAFLTPYLAGILEAEHGADTDEALASKGLHVDAETRRLVNFEMLGLMGAARRGLEAMQSGDWTLPRELEVAPKFTIAPKPSVARPKVTFSDIIDTQAAKRKAGVGAKPMPESSVKKYQRIARDFSKFRGSKDATTVKADEVEAWGEAMQKAGKVGNRSIGDRLVALGTIINWGKKQRQHKEAMATAETISGNVELPSYIEKPPSDTSYTMEEARMVLKAAREEADQSKRWLPWLCLYGGLRISEAESLRRDDFFQAEGEWFFRVTTAGKRTVKTVRSERVVPVHPALVAEDMLVWLEGQPTGKKLFRSSAYSYMGRWVRSKAVGITRKGVSPNHGLRHLFTGLCRRYGMGDEAGEYLAGHATAKVHAKYGSTEVMLPGLAAEIRKIEPLLPYEAEGRS